MTFEIIDGFTITGKTGYAMEALAFGKAHPGQVFRLEPNKSANAAGRLRAVGLTTKSSVAKDEAGNFLHVNLECVYNADSKEAVKAAELAANPRPKKPAVKKPKAPKAAKVAQA